MDETCVMLSILSLLHAFKAHQKTLFLSLATRLHDSYNSSPPSSTKIGMSFLQYSQQISWISTLSPIQCSPCLHMSAVRQHLDFVIPTWSSDHYSPFFVELRTSKLIRLSIPLSSTFFFGNLCCFLRLRSSMYSDNDSKKEEKSRTMAITTPI